MPTPSLVVDKAANTVDATCPPHSDWIITKDEDIRSTGTTYNLRVEDIQYLKEQGVSDAVVAEMQMRRPVRVIQPVYTRPVYVEPAPVVGVGVGFGYGRRW